MDVSFALISNLSNRDLRHPAVLLGAGHIARDCKNPRPGGAEGGNGADGGMDDEYSALMEELGERPARQNDSSARGRGTPTFRGNVSWSFFRHSYVTY